MTYASKLFYTRRPRIGRNEAELGFDSSSYHDRNLHHHHNNSRNRFHHQARDVEDRDTIRRSPLHHREYESARLEYSTGPSGTRNGSSTETLRGRANRLQFSGNELPGAVLLARERLLERLRGVSLTGNRQSSRGASDISWNELANNDGFGLVDEGQWQTQIPREWLAEGTPFTNSFTRTDLLSSLQDLSTKKPPGLSWEEMNGLHRELFNIEENQDGLVSRPEKECSICLERFQEGDWLICLPCGHRFHSACLYPWVQICGDCPYCRTGIDFSNQRTGKKISSSPH